MAGPWCRLYPCAGAPRDVRVGSSLSAKRRVLGLWADDSLELKRCRGWGDDYENGTACASIMLCSDGLARVKRNQRVNPHIPCLLGDVLLFTTGVHDTMDGQGDVCVDYTMLMNSTDADNMVSRWSEYMGAEKRAIDLLNERTEETNREILQRVQEMSEQAVAAFVSTVDVDAAAVRAVWDMAVAAPHVE